MPQPASSINADKSTPLLLIASLVMMLVSLYLIFVWVPTERTMGIVQRIFYFHVSSAFTAFLAFVIGGVASILYLVKRDHRYDDLSVACNESGLVFAVVNLITGSLWAKPVWLVWWAWDVRLTTMLLLALIYAGYLILRQSISEPSQRAVACAVVSIFGVVDIPIVYMANRWWRMQQHPEPVILGGEGSGLHPDMRTTLIVATAAMFVLLWCLVRARRRLEQTRREAEALRREVYAL